MRAISLMQPWATLVVTGAKTVETRCWRTAHRGRLAIHAGKRDTPPQRELLRWPAFAQPLAEAGYRSWEDLPRGAIIGAVDLVDCKGADEVRSLVPAAELHLGDFRPGRYGWIVANPVRLAGPVPWRGALGLFEVPDWGELSCPDRPR